MASYKEIKQKITYWVDEMKERYDVKEQTPEIYLTAIKQNRDAL